MQDGTYPSRNFATLGPSGLRPPFTGVYKKCMNSFFLPCSTGQVSDFIHHFLNLAKSYVFIKQSLPPLFNYWKSFLSQSYEVNLPSSFNTIIPYALVYSTNKLVLVLIQLYIKFFPILVKSKHRQVFKLI